MSAVVRGGGDPDMAARLWESFLEMGETAPIETGTMLFAFGLLVLALDLLRPSPVPRWTGAALLAFIALSMAADTSGWPWLLFGALYTAPLAVVGAAAARIHPSSIVEKTAQ
jgi:hypothetical protein